jgi:hypothetical protein
MRFIGGLVMAGFFFGIFMLILYGSLRLRRWIDFRREYSLARYVPPPNPYPRMPPGPPPQGPLPPCTHPSLRRTESGTYCCDSCRTDFGYTQPR